MSLKELRLEKEISQKEIFIKLKLKQNTYSQYETGKRTPSIEQLPKLAEVLNCSIEELVYAIIETKNKQSFNHYGV